jgi:uncharacterized protein (TIGR03000 family)
MNAISPLANRRRTLGTLASLLVWLLPAVAAGEPVKIRVEDTLGTPVPGATVTPAGGRGIETDAHGVTKESIPFNQARLKVKVKPPPDSNYQPGTFDLEKNVLNVQLQPLAARPPERRSPYRGLTPLCCREPVPCCWHEPTSRVLWTGDGCAAALMVDDLCRDMGEARLTVSVPSDAVVSINGTPRKITGSRRIYISKGLMYGYRYRYVVQARIVRDGKTVEDTKTVILRPGDSTEITLDFSANNN